MKRSAKLITMAAIIAVAALTTGCASIMHGDRQSVSIVSDQGTTIKVVDEAGNTVAEGKDQVAVSLKRGKEFFKGANYKIVVENGADKKETQLMPSMNLAYTVGNLFSWGIYGWIVDPYTGAMWTLKTPDGQGAKEVKIMLKDNVPKEVMDKAEKVEQ